MTPDEQSPTEHSMDTHDAMSGPRRLPLKGSRRKWVLGCAISIAALVVLFFIFDDILMPLYVKSGSKAIVPQVVGLQKDAAMKTLSDAGYQPIQYEIRFDEKAPEGTIVRQTPEAGEETKPGRKVYLILSGGKEMAIVPDLRGKSLRDAKMLLLKSNMSIGNVSYAYSDSAANGTVFQQTPPTGSKTSASTQVSVVVSEGQLMGRVPVPDLTKLTLAQAIEKLKNVKLELGKVSYQNGTPEDVVLDQYPPSGDLLNEGASVDLFVARGGTQTP